MPIIRVVCTSQPPCGADRNTDRYVQLRGMAPYPTIQDAEVRQCSCGAALKVTGKPVSKMRANGQLLLKPGFGTRRRTGPTIFELLEESDAQNQAELRARGVPDEQIRRDAEAADENDEDGPWTRGTAQFNLEMRLPTNQKYATDEGETVQQSFTQAVIGAVPGRSGDGFARPIPDAPVAAPASRGAGQQAAIKTHYTNDPNRQPKNLKHWINTTQAALPRGKRLYNATSVINIFQPANLRYPPNVQGRPPSAEWCHCLAASLGGPTARANLFAASFACNTYMAVIEDWLGRNSHKYPGLTIRIEIFYQRKSANPNTAQRRSSKLAPWYVVYSVQRGGVHKRFAIWARAREFGRADAEAVREELER